MAAWAAQAPVSFPRQPGTALRRSRNRRHNPDAGRAARWRPPAGWRHGSLQPMPQEFRTRLVLTSAYSLLHVIGHMREADQVRLDCALVFILFRLYRRMDQFFQALLGGAKLC